MTIAPSRGHDSGADTPHFQAGPHGAQRPRQHIVVFEDPGVCVGDDVGGDRQRQDQRPLERAPPRKIVRRHQPGWRESDHEGQNTHAHHEDGGVPHVYEQDRIDQVPPHFASTPQHAECDHDERQSRQGDGNKGRSTPRGQAPPGISTPPTRKSPERVGHAPGFCGYRKDPSWHHPVSAIRPGRRP